MNIPTLSFEEYHKVAKKYFDDFMFITHGYEQYLKDPEFSDEIYLYHPMMPNQLLISDRKRFIQQLIVARKLQAIKIAIDLIE